MKTRRVAMIGRKLASGGAIVLMLLGLSIAQGQEATEQFIPIGQSPGLSLKYTDIAEIEAVDPDNRTVTLASPTQSWSVLVSERTRIWLDRSHLGRSSVAGDFADLRPGLQAEVKYEDHERKTHADWIKVRGD